MKHIWAAKVTTTDPNTKRIWTEGEEAETASNIDSTTEEAFERYMEESILAGELGFRGEWHRKAVKEGAGFLSGLIPGNIGHLISILTSWKWELQTSLITETDHTTNISEYYFSLPVSAISENANQHVENYVALDFRGIYIDWFASTDTFYAAGGIYPEDEDRLNDQLTEAFDSGIFDLNPPKFDISTSEDYENEMIELLSQIK